MNILTKKELLKKGRKSSLQKGISDKINICCPYCGEAFLHIVELTEHQHKEGHLVDWYKINIPCPCCGYMLGNTSEGVLCTNCRFEGV